MYGDVIPLNSVERVYAGLVMFVGVAMCSVVVREITAKLQELSLTNEKRHINFDLVSRLLFPLVPILLNLSINIFVASPPPSLVMTPHTAQITSFMYERNVIPRVSIGIIDHMKSRMSLSVLYEEQKILSRLPRCLSCEIRMRRHEAELSKIHLFKYMLFDSMILYVFDRLEPMHWSRNYVLFRHGEVPSGLFIITSGRIGLYKPRSSSTRVKMCKIQTRSKLTYPVVGDADTAFAICLSENMLGHDALMYNRRYDVSARTLEPCSGYFISKMTFERIIMDQPVIAVFLQEALVSAILHQQTEQKYRHREDFFAVLKKVAEVRQDTKAKRTTAWFGDMFEEKEAEHMTNGESYQLTVSSPIADSSVSIPERTYLHSFIHMVSSVKTTTSSSPGIELVNIKNNDSNSGKKPKNTDMTANSNSLVTKLSLMEKQLCCEENITERSHIYPYRRSIIRRTSSDPILSKENYKDAAVHFGSNNCLLRCKSLSE